MRHHTSHFSKLASVVLLSLLGTAAAAPTVQDGLTAAGSAIDSEIQEIGQEVDAGLAAAGVKARTPTSTGTSPIQSMLAAVGYNVDAFIAEFGESVDAALANVGLRERA
ncbi:hypothetical protein MNV49_000650 [Pseudohyphozyma bogoriensis]|nr:hypothetical protein MNV49_000650 [Pseudohyphozyma bogoriensis]